MADIATRLFDTAAQENCDSEEYDLMQEAGNHIRKLEKEISDIYELLDDMPIDIDEILGAANE